MVIDCIFDGDDFVHDQYEALLFVKKENARSRHKSGRLSEPVHNCDQIINTKFVRSDAQLSSTKTRFQKCSQSGKNGSKHQMLSISMAFNVISCKKVERNTQKLKIADFTM